MANIVRRGENDPRLWSPGFGWDPFSLMREMLSYDPLRQMGSTGPMSPSTWTPQFEVKETGDAFVVKADLPGVSGDDIEVAVTGRQLTVSGHRDAEQRHEGDSYYTFERSYGSFTRVLQLPDSVDPENVQAELKDGVLTLSIPKREEVKPRRISLKGMVEKVKETIGVGDGGGEKRTERIEPKS